MLLAWETRPPPPSRWFVSPPAMWNITWFFTQGFNSDIAEEHLCLIRSPWACTRLSCSLLFFFYKGSLRLSAPQCRCQLWAPRGSSRATAPPWAPLFPCSARPDTDWLGVKWCVSWTTTTLTGRGRRTVNVSRNRKPLLRERRLFAAVGCCIHESNCL